MNRESDYEMILAMRRYGGSFIECLAELLDRADHKNYAKLEVAFPEYFERFREMAEQIKKNENTT